jgi:SAM-dependent methyltransferase
MTSSDSVELWNDEAATFDDAADHGLRDPAVRAAWRHLLLSLLPAAPARIADLGCGTGSLALLLAAEGYAVDGVDFSPEMIRRAREKPVSTGSTNEGWVTFAEGDADDPPLQPGAYDVVLCRHVLWVMPDPAATLRRWIGLLRPGGRLALIEGNWATGAGLTAARTVELVESTGREAELRLLPEAGYWGREIDDERYLVISRR